MATKKRKLSQAQLDALARGRAKMTAKREKKAPAKKRKAPAKVKPTAKSRATGKRPSTRLVKRRKKNVVKGCYPNPAKKSAWFIGLQSPNGDHGYWTGHEFNARRSFDTDIGKCASFPDAEAASNVAKKITGIPKGYKLGVGKKG